MCVSPADRKVLAWIKAEAEAQRILVLRLNRFGCIVLAPNLAEVRHMPSSQIPSHEAGNVKVNHRGHGEHRDEEEV